MKAILLASIAVIANAARPIYWGGDYSNAGLISMQITQNLTEVIAQNSEITNKSEDFL